MGKIFNALTKAADPISDPALHPASSLAAISGTAPQGQNAGAAIAADSSPMPPQARAEPLPLSTSPTGASAVETAAPSTAKAATVDANVNPVALAMESSVLLPSQARILAIRVPGGDPLLPFDSGPSRASEQYRYLRTKLIQHPRRPQCILVSSPGPGDGKTLTAVNLTGVLSLKTAADVVLVDADLRRSSVYGHLGIPNSPGLVDVLRGTSDLQDVIIHAEQFPNLFVIPAGESPENPTELLDSARCAAVLAKLRKAFKYVVLDSPPVGSVADYDLLQAACDGIVLVVRPDHTKRTLTQKAIATATKEKLLGVVLNCVEDWFLMKNTQYGAYSYSYAYGYEKGGQRNASKKS